MSDQVNGGRATPPEPAMAVSVMVVQFVTPGSAEFKIHFEGVVTPAQLFAVAGWLDWNARRIFDATLVQQAANRIAVPGMRLPPM